MVWIVEICMKYSVVIPVKNEEGNVAELHARLVKALKKLGGDFEIIFVDDASTDSTNAVLNKLKPVTIIRLRRSYGQSSALDAGIAHATGQIIITMDGDLQNDPDDIENLLAKLDEGYDVVCGWRKKRKDTFMKRFISRGAAYLRGFFVDDGVHDAGCTLRAYRKECFDDLELYGELHRMIPALLRWRGFSVTEIPVKHHNRVSGVSKYGYKRVIKGFLDMIYIWFWRKYDQRPLHFFGAAGIALFLAGAVLLTLMAYLRLVYGYPLSDKIWPMVAFFFMLIGLQLISTGLIAAKQVELSRSRRYNIRDIVQIR